MPQNSSPPANGKEPVQPRTYSSSTSGSSSGGSSASSSRKRSRADDVDSDVCWEDTGRVQCDRGTRLGGKAKQKPERVGKGNGKVSKEEKVFACMEKMVENVIRCMGDSRAEDRREARRESGKQRKSFEMLARLMCGQNDAPHDEGVRDSDGDSSD